MSELARRYARALFESSDPPVEETLLAQQSRALIDCEPLWAALCNPVVHPIEKQAVLQSLPLFQEPLLLRRFFFLLAEKRRLNLLPDILDAYHELVLDARNIAHCVLRSAHPMDAAQLERIRAALCKQYHKRDILFTTSVDPALLGGFILQMGGVTYDQSVRGQLERLERRLNEVNR